MKMTRSIIFFSTLISLGLMSLACQERASSEPPVAQGAEVEASQSGRVDFSGDRDGAEALLKQFLNTQIDRAALTKKLRPNSEDFKAVFIKDSVKAAYEGYQRPWEEGKIVVRGRPGQTQLKIWSATTEQLLKNTEEAQIFPGGYQVAAPHFKPGLTFYFFKFVVPGQELGFAWDGLVYVNGRWVLFPKPWRVLPQGQQAPVRLPLSGKDPG